MFPGPNPQFFIHNFSLSDIARKQSKEGLAKTAGNITDSLMSIAKMMESQVQQSENNTESLSKLCHRILEKRIQNFHIRCIYND